MGIAEDDGLAEGNLVVKIRATAGVAIALEFHGFQMRLTNLPMRVIVSDQYVHLQRPVISIEIRNYASHWTKNLRLRDLDPRSHLAPQRSVSVGQLFLYGVPIFIAALADLVGVILAFPRG